MDTITVYKINTHKGTFYCREGLDQFFENNEDWLTTDCNMDLLEMTEEEYNSIPATQEAFEAFA